LSSHINEKLVDAIVAGVLDGTVHEAAVLFGMSCDYALDGTEPIPPQFIGHVDRDEERSYMMGDVLIRINARERQRVKETLATRRVLPGMRGGGR